MKAINSDPDARSKGTMLTGSWRTDDWPLSGSAPTLASHAQHLAVQATADALTGHVKSRTTPGGDSIPQTLLRCSTRSAASWARRRQDRSEARSSPSSQDERCGDYQGRLAWGRQQADGAMALPFESCVF